MRKTTTKKVLNCANGHSNVRWTFRGNIKNIPACPICKTEVKEQ
jgi:hypothetical protein